MAAPASNAVLLGDVHFDDVSTKPCGVHFRERTRRVALRANVNLRKPKPLNGGILNFGCSTSDASWSSWNPSSLYKNSSFFARCSAETTPHVQHLATSTFSIDQYVCCVLFNVCSLCFVIWNYVLVPNFGTGLVFSHLLTVPRVCLAQLCELFFRLKWKNKIKM